ncbi:MAG: triphosphoribosyl-dephospho-CoA synthase [Alphaproteobacteria bacterium]|nr:triphosphoribosyl-dephospho-CoA synthase [Alphaproteobacteria bacterium]
MAERPQLISSEEIAGAFSAACTAELRALKPGNVHVFAGGHDMDVQQFENSAKAAASHIANPQLRLGARIKGAIDASLEAAGCNTNLGIVLLCAPLAAAFERTTEAGAVQGELAQLLHASDRQDAIDVFAAIRKANPGGLGRPARGDVAADGPQLDLLEAMQLASGFDRIAFAYVTDFEHIFAHHLPVLARAQKNAGADTPATDPGVITTLFMQMLQDFPDSHIGRKFGAAEAARVQERARALSPHWAPLPGGTAAHRALLDFDQELKAEGLNPGTTADFVVATVFAGLLTAALPHTKGLKPLALGP